MSGINPTKTSGVRRLETVLVLVALMLTPGCTKPEKPTVTPMGSDLTVEPGKTVAFEASSTSSSAVDRFKWNLDGDGRISAPMGTRGERIVYTAPLKEGAMSLLTVVASNRHGESLQTSVNISVPANTSVALESLAIPAGWMSGGEPARHLALGSGAPGCHSGSDCLRFTFTSGAHWGGIYWWPPACGNSGTADAWARIKRPGLCGVNVLAKGGFSAVSRLSFWAKGEKGGEVIEFRVGADDVLPRPGRSRGNVTLTPQWKLYQIPLKDVDLTDATVPFGWIATDLGNPAGAVFYLDDVQFEGFGRG
jgi:hypothetical protein